MKTDSSSRDVPGAGDAPSRWTDHPDAPEARLLHPLSSGPAASDRQRIWAGLTARLHEQQAPRRRVPAWGLAAAALAAVAIGVVALRPQSAQQIAAVEPERTVVAPTAPTAPLAPTAPPAPPAVTAVAARSGAPTRYAVRHRTGALTVASGRTAGDSLAAGETIRTGANGRVVLAWEGGSLALDPRSKAQLGGPSEPGVRLVGGRIHLSLRKHSPERPFVVRAAGYEVIVTGTVFSVDVRRNRLGVSVERGSVQVRGGEGTYAVTAGRRFDSRSSRVTAARGVDRGARAALTLIAHTAGDDQDRARARRDPRRPVAPARAADATGVTSSSDGASRTTGDEVQRSARADGHEAALVPAVAAAPRAVESNPTPSQPLTQVPQNVEPSLQPAAPPAVTRDPLPSAARTDGAGSYGRAIALASSDPREAVRLLDRVAAGNGPQAETARLRAARLTARFDAAASARRLEEFVTRHGDGPFGHDARLDLVEQRLRGGLAAAAPAVEAFLAHHPDSDRVPEMLAVRAEIARIVHKRCADALPDYETASQSPRAAESALRGKAICLRTLGDTTRARAVAQEYLRRFPHGRHAAELRALDAASGESQR